MHEAIERALHALVAAAAGDSEPAVALAALRVLAEYAAVSDAVEKSSVLRATCEATAAVVWDLLLGRANGISERFDGLASGGGGGVSESDSCGSEVKPRVESVRLFERRSVLRSLGRLAAHALRGASIRVGREGTVVVQEANSAAQDAVRWAVAWVDNVLVASCDDGDWRVARCASTCLLVVCTYCKADVWERQLRCGYKAVSRIVRPPTCTRENYYRGCADDDAVHAVRDHGAGACLVPDDGRRPSRPVCDVAGGRFAGFGACAHAHSLEGGGKRSNSIGSYTIAKLTYILSYYTFPSP